MVTETLLALALLAAPAAPAAEGPTDAEMDRAIGRALGQSRLPWYDPAKDSARPIQIPDSSEGWWSRSSSDEAGDGDGDSWWPWKNRSASSSAPKAASASGNTAGLLWFAAGLIALLGVLIWLFRRFDPFAGIEPAPKRPDAAPGLVDMMPEGLPIGFDASDPWAEAVRRRAGGDLAGAIICLFAHQMLTLSRLGLVRLAPGRTGRQLVRAVTDVDLRGMVRTTLGLFEATYYGRLAPTPEAFAAAWAQAEAFEKRVAAGGLR